MNNPFGVSFDQEQIQAIFDELVDLTNSRKHSRVQEIRSVEPQLADLVTELLRKDERNRSERFLETDEATIKDRIRPGDQVGSFKIQKHLGQGAFGSVFLAISELEQQVAIKFLNRWEQTEEGRQRFQQEAEALARLKHPCIASLMDRGQLKGTPYLITDYIAGTTLSRVDFDKEEFPVAGRVRLLIDICDAVQFAHQELILHRDIKPGNVIVRQDGRGVLTDFGLAKFLDNNADRNLTYTGQLVGTPKFMSPEQIEGKSSDSTSVDIYGLGALMYFLLTGNPPFRDDGLTQLADKIRYEMPQDPRKYNDQVDKDLINICFKCLQKDPADRYTSVALLKQDLENWALGYPVTARSLNRVTHLKYWTKRNPKIAILSAICFLAVCAGFVCSTYFWQVSQNSLIAAQQQKSDLLETIQTLVEKEADFDDGNKDAEFRFQILLTIVDAFDRLESREQLDDTLMKTSAVARLKLGRLYKSRGEKEIGVGHIKDAQAKFQQLSDKHPLNIDYRYDIFHCLDSRHETEAAHQCLLNILANDDSNIYHRDALSHSYMKMGMEALSQCRLDEAVDFHTKGIELSAQICQECDPDRVPFFNKNFAMQNFQRFRAHARLGHWEQAESDLIQSSLAFAKSYDSMSEDQAVLSQYCNTLLVLAGWNYFDNDHALAAEALGKARSVSKRYVDIHWTHSDAYQTRFQTLIYQSVFAAENIGTDTLSQLKKEIRTLLDEWRYLNPESRMLHQSVARFISDPNLNDDPEPARAIELVQNGRGRAYAIFRIRLKIMTQDIEGAIQQIGESLNLKRGVNAYLAYLKQSLVSGPEFDAELRVKQQAISDSVAPFHDVILIEKLLDAL